MMISKKEGWPPKAAEGRLPLWVKIPMLFGGSLIQEGGAHYSSKGVYQSKACA